MRKNELISVVICTYNRADLARQAIASVLAQDFPQTDYELVIVDNNSSDQTRAQVQEFCQSYPNVRYFLESKIGLSFARNRGWQEAAGKYVAYIDDDCKVPPTWLNAASRVIEQERPAAFGGPYYAFYNSPKPAWFKDEYGSHVQGIVARSLKMDEYLCGGNMFLRLDILKKLGGFDTEFGMKGDKYSYGEETEFFHRLRMVFPDSVIYYDPALFVYHLVRAEKMKLMKVMRMSFDQGRDYAKFIEHIPNSKAQHFAFQVVELVLKNVKSFSWDMVWRDRNLYPFHQNFLYEVSFELVMDLGFSLGRLREKVV